MIREKKVILICSIQDTNPSHLAAMMVLQQHWLLYSRNNTNTVIETPCWLLLSHWTKIPPTPTPHQQLAGKWEDSICILVVYTWTWSNINTADQKIDVVLIEHREGSVFRTARRSPTKSVQYLFACCSQSESGHVVRGWGWGGRS